MSSNTEDMDVSEEQNTVEQIPSVVKSHLPPHLQPRGRKPLEASKPGVNAVTTTGGATPAIVRHFHLILIKIDSKQSTTHEFNRHFCGHPLDVFE